MSIKPAVWFPTIQTGTGTEVFTIHLVAGLQKRGVRAEITWLPRRAEFLPWTVSVPQAPKWANIVHVNTWLHARFIPSDLPIMSTSHLCVHDPLLMRYKSWPQKIYHDHWVARLESAVLRRSRCITAVSQYTADCTERVFSVDGIKVIHNGVVIKSRESDMSGRCIHQPFRLLYVGNWSARKGVDLLPQIMTKLGEKFELWYTSDAHGADKKINLPENCRCLGRLNSKQLEAVYSSVDALLFPSRLEGLPLTVVESMAKSLPVIAADNSSLAELVLDGETGFLCAQDNIDEFVAAVKALAVNEVVWRRMGFSAFARASQRFSIEVMVDKYMELYRRCVSVAT